MTPRRQRRGACEGFSLLEVVVFIVVLGVLLAGLVAAFSSSLRLSPQAGELDLVAELAQQRMELILAQRRATGFPAFADPCVPGPGPAACVPPAGYTVASSIAAGWGGDPSNFKVVTVDVTGPSTTAGSAALVGNY
jgi:type II secretory pathway pseudopilin PulG